jgi:hypothetical protein
MSLRPRFGLLTAPALFLAAAFSARGQEPPPPPTLPPAAPPAATPTPAPAFSTSAPLRLSDKPSLRVDRLPAENPFGLAAESPATLPIKPAFAEQTVDAAVYAAVHVDKTGKVVGAQFPRNPIPSLAAEERRSFDRWTFDPAHQGGKSVDTWASVRVELTVDVKPPKVEQIGLSPVLPAAPVPAPLEWGPDSTWYDGFHGLLPGDGSVAVEQAETLAVPTKTKWDADSFKGAFAIRMWIKVNAAGRAERSIPIQTTDPVLISYFRKQVAGWQFHPATVKGQPAESWAELSVVGQIAYSVEVKQIANLRKTLVAPSEARP